MYYLQKGLAIENRKQILSGLWCSQVFRRHSLASLSHSSHLIHGGGGGGGGGVAAIVYIYPHFGDLFIFSF